MSTLTKDLLNEIIKIKNNSRWESDLLEMGKDQPEYAEYQAATAYLQGIIQAAGTGDDAEKLATLQTKLTRFFRLRPTRFAEQNNPVSWIFDALNSAEIWSRDPLTYEEKLLAEFFTACLNAPEKTSTRPVKTQLHQVYGYLVDKDIELIVTSGKLIKFDWHAPTWFRKHTRLHLAVRANDLAAVKLILAGDKERRTSADVDRTEFSGNTPLSDAIRMEFVSDAILLEVLAAQHSQYAMETYILYGPHILVKVIECKRSDTVFKAVALHPHLPPLCEPRVINQIFARAASLKLYDFIAKKLFAQKVLADALLDSHRDLVITSLKEAINTNAITVEEMDQILTREPRLAEGQYGLLREAARQGRTDIVTCLLDKGADVRGLPPKILTEDDGQSALHLAAQHGHLETVQAILAKDPSLVNDQSSTLQRTPLWYAACSKKLPVVQELIARGANVNAQDYQQISILLAAVRLGQYTDATLPVVEALLNASADVHAGNEMLRTPMHVAIKGKHVSLILALLGKMTAEEVSTKQYYGKTLATHAQENKWTEVTKAIEAMPPSAATGNPVLARHPMFLAATPATAPYAAPSVRP